MLADAGLLEGKNATAYPGVLEAMENENITITGAAVEQDGKVLTSRGPGTAMDFALAIISCLLGNAKREQVETALVRAA